MSKFGFFSFLVFLAWLLTPATVAAGQTGAGTGFRHYFALELEGNASYYLFALTSEAHQASMAPDGRDFRIIDADGNLVPYAFGGTMEEAPKEPSLRPVPWFPLPDAQSGKKVLDGFIIAADGTLRSRERQVEPKHRSGDIVDLSGIADKDSKKPPKLNALFIRLGTPAGGTGEYLGSVEVLASNDLQNWSPVKTAQLLRLDHHGQRLERERIDLDDVLPAKPPQYLQLRWRGAPPLIASVEAELLMPQDDIDTVQPQFKKQGEFRYWREKLPGHMQPGGEVFFDTGGVFPVDRLRFHLPRPNTVVSVALYSRTDENLPWKPVRTETLYRLQGSDGTEQETSEIRIAPNRDRFWKMAVENERHKNSTSKIGSVKGDRSNTENLELGGTPLLSIGWRPETVTFLARGTPPFLLAAGNAQATDAGIPLARLLVGNKPHLATAQIGAAQQPPKNAPTISSALSPEEQKEQTRRYILWGVLLATVALLALMAWKVARHLPREEVRKEDERR